MQRDRCGDRDREEGPKPGGSGVLVSAAGRRRSEPGPKVEKVADVVQKGSANKCVAGTGVDRQRSCLQRMVELPEGFVVWVAPPLLEQLDDVFD